jgi:ribonuclease P protein component
MPVVGRLRKRPDFLKVAAARSKWVTPGLILQARRRPVTAGPAVEDAAEAELVRVGFTVSRKVGKAVQRNRARRRLKAVAAEVLPGHARPGYDYVLIGRGGTLERPYGALVEDLRSALDRVGQSGGRGPGKGIRRHSGPERRVREDMKEPSA